jgi:hypothetical protein
MVNYLAQWLAPNAGTELTFTDAQLVDEEFRRGHEDGWKCSLEKLEARFARGIAA